ncbi:leucine-rich PPR motif-containing protein, mitochondrial [Zerene cesonia]|uniref:leucine-rich PPR motif-containing protein, mitochondrial n=1 Tax=Zerene cesonia TaxID=33412 RepID=UPI0018E561C9|nr:leucine-rich PPR motif-containing protein, mitochondrial [Zerene cesonia]
MSSLLRSTKFVRYFTGAARTLILNSAKTAETNSLINPKSICASNSIILRDYATSKKTESLEPLLQRLDSEVKRYGRISKKDIDEVFDEIRAKNDITSSQSLLVIRCCGELVPEELPEQRTLLVQKIWNVLTERGIPMDVSHYNALLRVYLENEHTFSPAKFLEEMEKKGLQPNRVTYQRLMWRYCQEGDVEGATKVLEKMRELNMPVSEPVLNALVMGHAFHGDTEGAKAVLETMAGAGLTPSNRTYTLLACGYAKQGDIENVKKIIALAQDNESMLADRDLLEIIEHMAIGGHNDKVEEIFPHLHKSIGYNQDVCNLIYKLLNRDCDSTAQKVMKTMPKSSNVDETIFKGAFYVKHLVKLNRPADSLIASCKELQEEGLVPRALYIATEMSLQLGHVEVAQKLLKELQKEGFELRQHYFWPLLVQKGKEGDEEGLLQILRNMTSENLTPTGETLREYVIPYLIKKDSPQNIILKLQIANVPVFHGARNLIVELLRLTQIKQAADVALQYQPRGGFSLLAQPLTSALSKTKDIDSFVKILHVISNNPQLQAEEDATADDSPINNDISGEVGRIVKNAVKYLKEPKLTENLLQSVLDKGLRISVQSAEEIEQYLGNQMTMNISKILSSLTSPHLEYAPLESMKMTKTKLTSEKLESLIANNKEKGNNTAKLQKQLLMTYMDENKIEKLDQFLEELKASNFELTMVTLTRLYEFYADNGQIEKAKNIGELIKEKDPKFVINRYKKVTMATALIKHNKYDEALQFLKDNKPEDDINSNFVLNAKCWQMLNTLAEEKDVAKVKELTETLINYNYVAPSNVLLGPSIKVHILRNDIDGALSEFENCCNQYRSTPWKGELMKTLILKEDANKLQWLADLSTQIHGEINILHDLVLAFVECGRLRQARRILETPGLLSRQRRLNDACERYVEEGKSEYLEGLLEATKDLSIVDRSNIFYHLLVTYCKADETDKAIGLWTVLQEEGEIPTDDFLNYLGNHLKSKNMDVPFIIPQQSNVQQTKKENPINKVVQPAKPSKKQVTVDIEKLVQTGLYTQAMDSTIKSIKNGSTPKSSILKYLLKSLAIEGNVEQIERLGKYIDNSMRKLITYDDKLTQAIFKNGSGDQHLDNLLAEIEAANTEEDLKNALIRYPRSSALASAVNSPVLSQKCQKIADIAASKGIYLPANLLWMEYLLAGKTTEAQALWDTHLKKAEVVIFRRLLQESHMQRNAKLIEDLIHNLKTNTKLQLSTLGNAYSRLINLHIVDNKFNEAKAVLEDAYKAGVTNEHLNKTSLQRLKSVFEANGKPFEYSI